MKKIALILALSVTAACSQAADSPMSPTSPMVSTFAGANGETMKVSAPQLVFPVSVVDLDDDDPDFEWLNAKAKYAGAKVFTYDFEVYVGSARVVSLSRQEGSGGRTRFEIPSVIDRGTQFTWRVRARQGTLVGPWSSSASFSTKALPTCLSQGPNPLAIITCHRERFPAGRLDNADDAYDFLTSIARDFNKVKYDEWDTWGVLQKLGGRNCNGISCDIICRGEGSGQKQWDVLTASEFPKWDAPHQGSEIRPDVCLIQR